MNNLRNKLYGDHCNHFVFNLLWKDKVHSTIIHILGNWVTTTTIDSAIELNTINVSKYFISIRFDHKYLYKIIVNFPSRIDSHEETSLCGFSTYCRILFLSILFHSSYHHFADYVRFFRASFQTRTWSKSVKQL